MDAARFDRIATSLAAGSSRRQALLAVLGGALGIAAGGTTAAHDAREKCDKIDNRQQRRRCAKRAKRHNEGHDNDCDPSCPAGSRCLHGACTCDPFNNGCPNEIDGQCGCGAVVSDAFEAACVDRNSACDLDRPCSDHGDCPQGSVCLVGCRDASDPLGTNRCSKPCVAV